MMLRFLALMLITVGVGWPATVAAATPTETAVAEGRVDAVGLTAPLWSVHEWTAPASETITVRVRWAGRAELASDVRTSDGRWVANGWRRTSPLEYQARVEAGTTYRLAVWARSGRTDYRISVVASTAAGGTDLSSGFLDRDAVVGPVGVRNPWTSSVTGTVRFRLTWTGQATLGLDVRRADGGWLANTAGATSPLELSVPVRAGTTYRIGAWALSGSAEYRVNVTAAQAPKLPGPNIVIVNLDDARFDATQVLPKVLDWFSDGRTYTNAFISTPSCCPSRATQMGGQYVHNNGQRDQDTPSFRPRTSIQRYLSEAGWFTGHAGKYLHYLPLSEVAPHWDRWTHFQGGYENVWVNLDGRIVQSPTYSTTLVFDRAIDYLEDFERRDDDRPFYLQLTPVAPHAPRIPEARYADAPVPPFDPPPSVGEADRSDKPPVVSFLDVTRNQAAVIRRQSLRTLMSVDDQFDRLMRRLDALGELDDTLVILTSDNGYFWGEHGRTQKFLPYTEAVKVPFLVRWPGHVSPGTYRDLVSHVDILPTVLSAAGVSWNHTVDGRDILAPGFRRRELFTEYFEDPANNNFIPDWASLRTARWIYNEYYEGDRIVFREYYDLANDPWELSNVLADGRPANDPDVAALSQRLARARSCSGASCP